MCVDECKGEYFVGVSVSSGNVRCMSGISQSDVRSGCLEGSWVVNAIALWVGKWLLAVSKLDPTLF